MSGILVANLCAHNLAAYPDLSVDIDERPSTEIVLAIAEARADLGIVADTADLTTSDAFVGLSDAALEIHLGEHASRLGRQINYRAQLRSVENVGMLAEAGIGIAIMSEASAAQLRRPGLAILPLLEPWASGQLHLCVRDFSALTPHANLFAQQLMGKDID